MRRMCQALGLAVVAALGCLPAGAVDAVPPADAEVNVAPALPPVSIAALAIKQRLDDRRLDATVDERHAAASFYEARQGAPLLADGHGLTAKGAGVLSALRSADDYGLTASDLVPIQLPAPGAVLDDRQIADLEVRMAVAALTYARDARGGRIPDPSKQLASYLDRTPQLAEPRSILEALAAGADADAVLRGYNPQSPAFEALRKAYNEARAATASGEDVRVPDGPSIRPGMRSPIVAAARKLLKRDPPTVDGHPGDVDVYDPGLVEAIGAFQTEQGLEPADGIIGGKTRAALNTLRRPATRTLLANMEAWRWMPTDLGDTYIAVNIPEFTIRMIEHGTVIHTERVVTGLVTNQTPVFSDALQTVVLQPDWVLPESIKVREALPSLLGGGGMFYSSGLRIKKGDREISPHSVNWYSANLKAYTFYQPPGAANALGQVKFLFPNKHAVYMHDTPAKHLFDSPVRAFSHGCVRVRNPVHLAELVLAHDKAWPAEKVRQLVQDGPEDNRIPLDHPIPVHITYFTAVPDETGKIRTLRDIYGHEERISLALEGRWGEIDIPPDHLAPIEDREFEAGFASYGDRRQDEDFYGVHVQRGAGSEIERALKGLFGGF